MKKYYILAFAFLCLLMGQSSYAQDWQDMGFDAETTSVLQQFEDAGVKINAYTDTQTYINDVNSDSNPNNNFIDYNGDGIVNTADMGTLIAMSDAELNATLALTVQLHEVVVFNYYHDPIKYIYYELDYTNPFVQNDICTNYPAYCYFQNVPILQGSFSITDSNNPDRTVSNGQTLVMVNSGSARQASMEMTTSFGGDVTWSGNGVTGNSSSATYSGTTSTSVIASCASSGLAATGNIQIVNENKVNLSYKIAEIENKINDVSDAFRNFVEAKGSTVSPGTKSLSLTGTLERKNVDMYADGTKNGSAVSFDLNGTYSLKMPEIEIPFATYGLLSAKASLDLGTATGAINITGTLDDSTAAKAEIEGGFELGFTAMSLTLKAILGAEKKLCIAATGGIEAGYFTVGAKVEGNTNGSAVLLTPEVKVGELSISYHFTVSAYDAECTLDEGTYPILNEQTLPYSPVILYQK